MFLETWKRRSAKVNLEWGLDDYKDDVADDARVQYVGDMRLGFYCEGGFVPLGDLAENETKATRNITTIEEGKKNNGSHLTSIPKNPYGDPRMAQIARIQSFGVTVVFMILVGSLTFLLLWYRNNIIDYISDKTNNAVLANAFPGVLNGVLITVFDSVWRPVSLTLTRRENHRTVQEYENSLVFKRFGFQAVSNCRLLLTFPFTYYTCTQRSSFADIPIVVV